MKRNLFQRLSASCGRRGALAALLACCVLAACSKDEALPTRGTPLPERQYPLVLTAAMLQAEAAPASRATVDGTWEGGERIRVQVVSIPSDDDAPAVAWGDIPVLVYTVATDGTMTLTEGSQPYWQSTGETMHIRAWYPGTRSDYTTIPLADGAWSIAGNTGQSDQVIAADDFLYAYAKTAFNPNGEGTTLRFRHLMTNININIAASDYLNSYDVSVSLTGFALEGKFAGAVSELTLVEDPAATPGDIAPQLIVTYSSQRFASYRALVIPQSIAGNDRKIAVQVGATRYEWIVNYKEHTELCGGTEYTFNITVKAEGLEVSVANDGGAWTDGGSEEVTSKEVKAVYRAEDLKIGDYFYSNGTTSDGGLRKLYADGTMEIADPKPEPETEEGKTVVGIVFQTDPSRIGEAEKEALAAKDVGEPHGLVMAVKNAGTSKTWGPYGTDEGLTKCVTKADNYNDISGYGNCEHIRKKRTNFDNYPAFKAADEWNTTCPVPVTTGWYLPASGQWWDILQNLGGCPDLANKSEQTSSGGGDFTWSGQGDILTVLNRWMAYIDDGNKNTFSSHNQFWSSSEGSSYIAWSWYVGSDGYVRCGWSPKYNGFDVRPVLAF